MPKTPYTIDRRTFLKGLAAAGTGAWGASALANRADTTPFRLGLLQVESRRYPQLGDSLLAGLEAGLHAHGIARPIELIPLATPATPGGMVGTVESFLARSPVHLLVGPVGQAATVLLAPLLARRRTPLIATGAGANTLRGDERSPWIAHNTLQHWRGSWALGAWAAQRPGTRVAVVTSLYDSGFDHLYAFEAGVTSHGGALVGSFISDALPGSHDLPALLARLTESQPDTIFVLHSDPFARRLLAAIATTPALAASVVMTTGLSQLASGMNPAANIKVVSWSPRLDFAGNWAFLSHIGHQGPSDSFTMLGYETGQLIGQLLSEIGDELQTPGRFVKALARLRVVGPRGPLAFEAERNSFRAPLYLQSPDGGLAPLTDAAVVTEEHPKIAALHAGARSGWLTDYLFMN